MKPEKLFTNKICRRSIGHLPTDGKQGRGKVCHKNTIKWKRHLRYVARPLLCPVSYIRQWFFDCFFQWIETFYKRLLLFMKPFCKFYIFHVFSYTTVEHCAHTYAYTCTMYMYMHMRTLCTQCRRKDMEM